jgi:cellulose synthase/poly-beta-1,6-N-acetylglucosamine synthase-like glycosyltransferase
MFISRKPPFPLTVTIPGFIAETQYALVVTNDYAVDMYEESVLPDAEGVITWELPDYFARYDATYRIEVYLLENFIPPSELVLGDLVFIDTLTIARPYVDPATLVDSTEDLAEAEQYEALARAMIDSITGGFKYEREIIEATGLGADYVPSPVRLNKIIRVYENSVCVYDSESTDPEWTNAKEYSISPDRTAITANVAGAYNRYQSRPIRIHNSQSDSFTPYNLDMASKEEYIAASENGSFFPTGYDYVFVVDAGWPVIPNDIKQAATLLYNDLKCNNMPYMNSYIKEYESGQFTLKFDPNAFTRTGNKIVDNILSNYPRGIGRLGVV